MKKKSKLGLGLLLGAVGGAIAGILYAPKSGKETREEIEQKTKDAYSKVSKEAKDAYVMATKMVQERVNDLKKRAGRVDRQKYQQLVTDAVNEIKKTGNYSAETLKTLGQSLASDWKKFVAAPKKASSKRKSNGKAKKASK